MAGYDKANVGIEGLMADDRLISEHRQALQ